VPAARPDPRSADPYATQKISREQLEEALKRTKSGTRRALRSEPEIPPNENDPRRERDSLPGPREDDDNPHIGPQVTIVRIDSVEMETIDPLSLAPIRSTRSPAARATPTPIDSILSPTSRLHVTPRIAFIAGLAVALFALLAAAIGFFAGRIAPGSR
jgi:hypothetical protein